MIRGNNMASSENIEKRKFLGSKPFWLLIAALVVIAGGIAAFLIWDKNTSEVASTNEAALQTARVRRGDLRVSVTGSGSLVSGREIDLAFSASGTVGALAVKVGDRVEEGQVLASLADTSQLQANVAEKRLAFLKAQQTLQALYEKTDVAIAEAYQAVVAAQSAYDDALFAAQRTAYARCSQAVNIQKTTAYERAKQELERLSACCSGSDAWIEAKNVFDTAYANWVYCSAYSEGEVVVYNASLQVAQTSLGQAQETLNKLEQNEGIDVDQVALAQAEYEQAKLALEVAQMQLDGSVLTAPFSGTVISIAARVGEAVSTDTFITLADMENLQVVVYVDETDMDQFRVGLPAEIVFDALPDLIFKGEVIQVKPELVAQGGYQLATGLISLDMNEGNAVSRILLGLSGTVDVISGEAINVLLIPVEALRDLEGQYGVFVQDADGTLRLRVVEVGLSDYTYAEVRDGLQEGEIVSTGIRQTN
jgi:RND family efflux transporter MFP subunit